MDILKCPKTKYGFENPNKLQKKSGCDHNGTNSNKIISGLLPKVFLR
jgi:hypothetical protein